MPPLPPRPHGKRMPGAASLLEGHEKGKGPDEDDDDEEERRDEGSFQGQSFNGGGIMGTSDDLFRTRGGSLRPNAMASGKHPMGASGNNLLMSTQSGLPRVPTFTARRAAAPKGSHDALEVSFTALLDEEASHEHDAANAAANANANLASTSNAPSSLAHGETPEEAHKREHDAKMAATKAKQAAAEEASGGQHQVGRYVHARLKLKRAEADHDRALSANDAQLILARAGERELDELVRLSSMTGAPTLANPATRLQELAKREQVQKRHASQHHQRRHHEHEHNDAVTAAAAAAAGAGAAGGVAGVGAGAGGSSARVNASSSNSNSRNTSPATSRPSTPSTSQLGSKDSSRRGSKENSNQLDHQQQQQPFSSGSNSRPGTSATEKAAPVVDPPATEIERAVYRSFVAGEFACVGESLQSLPPELANTLTMQMGLTQLYLPRNHMSRFEAYGPKEARHLSAKHMMHVKEIDIQHNKTFSSLWSDIGSLYSLTRLSVQHTSLYEFPPSFLWLTQLKHIDLTHCNFKALPDNLGTLVNLEFLGLRENMLMELPPTFYLLKALKKLDVSRNGLPCLAIRTPSEGPDPAVVAAWEKIPMPSGSSGGGGDDTDGLAGGSSTMWYNRVTGESRQSEPPPVRAARLAKTAGTSPDKTLVGDRGEGSAPYNARKSALATGGISEFEYRVDAKLGMVYYINHVNGTTQWDLPYSMDTFGLCGGLEVLKLNDNLLRDLPESLSLLVHLKHLEVKSNYLKYLPYNIGSMTALKVLRIPGNEITELPQSISVLTNLVECNLTANHLATLPAYVGDMVGLRSLLLGNNRLAALPYKLGFCSEITDLQVYNNPLQDPPYEEVLMGAEHLLWGLRQRFLEATRGAPPLVTPQLYGIGDERNEILPLFLQRLQKKVELAKTTGELELLQDGLKKMPPPITAGHLLNLNRLVMVAQHFGGEDKGGAHVKGDLGEGEGEEKAEEEEEESPSPVFPEGMTQLHTLWMKRCELKEIHPSVGLLRGIKDLDLSENQISDLHPHVFRHMKKLEVVNLTKNHLFTLPDELGNLPYLKEMHVGMNRLDVLPDTFTKLSHLEIFSATMNRLVAIPQGMGKLQHLRVLNLESNQLHRLPPGMGMLHLRELRCSHNRLEVIDSDLLTPNLQHSIEVLQLSNNNLLELPAIFDGCAKLKQLAIEYNPLRSPPAELLEEDLETVLQYCRVRTSRFQEMSRLLKAFGFEVNEANFAPTAKDAVTGNTGMLTPADRALFDDQLDQYVNGKFYDCLLTASDCVDSFDQLRHQRQYVFNQVLIQELLAVIMAEISKSETQVPRKRFSNNIIRSDLRRRWGRRKEKVFCYAVSLDPLLQDTLPNKYVKKFRPSLFKLAVARLPVTVFEYLPEMLRQAIQDFEGPYGFVGKIEPNIDFPLDEYVDPNTGRERNTFPAELPALVITRVVYTASEAKRRQGEDEDMWRAFQEKEMVVDDWLQSRIGRKRLAQEMKSRKRDSAKNVEEKSVEQQEANEKVLQLREEVNNVAERRQDFDAGAAFHEHRIDSLDHAVELTNAAEAAVEEGVKNAKRIDDAVSLLHRILQMPKAKQELWNVKDLKRKYCHKVWLEMLQTARLEAYEHGWRRPWDGTDGEAFHAWSLKHELKLSGVRVASDPDPFVKPEGEDDDDEQDEFDWHNTKFSEGSKEMGGFGMDKYNSEAYLRYLKEVRPIDLRNPWDLNYEDPIPAHSPDSESSEEDCDDEDEDDDDEEEEEEGGGDGSAGDDGGEGESTNNEDVS